MKLNLQFFAEGSGNEQGSQNQQGAQNAAGAEDNQNNNANGNSTDGTNNDDSGEQGKTEKMFTQHQVSAMMSKEKKQGKAAAYAELGLDPNDTKTISMFKAFVEAQKTEEQKAAEVASKQAAAVADAERRAMIAEAKAEALQAGVKSDYVDDCITVAISKVNETTDLASALKELKTKYPIWFNSDDSANNNGKTGQKGTGTSISKMGSTAGGTNGNESLAAKLVAARKGNGNASKSSFWG
jgi:hypothetical protein